MLSTRSLLCAAALFVLGCGSDASFLAPTGDTTPIAPADARWKLVFEDDFEGPAGTPPSDMWVYDLGNGRDGWGNLQLEYDTNRPENVSLDGQGNLVITARKEPFSGFNYTSGRIKTEGRLNVHYGRVAARMKLPKGKGIWPAFWMLGANYQQVTWPHCGEIDIMELAGSKPRQVRGSLHGPSYYGGNNLGRYYDAGQDLSANFHEYAVVWTEEGISFEFDGKTYFTARRERIDDWVFDHPFFIILNLAVGGMYDGDPDDTTVFPQQLVVDYVRVYELEK